MRSKAGCRSTTACATPRSWFPGLVMMSVLQNAFANSSSSLIQSKITGNIVFVLLAPHLLLRVLRAPTCSPRWCAASRSALGVLAVTLWFVELRLQAPLWALGLRAARRGARSARSACSPASCRRRSTSSPRSRTSSSCRSLSSRACSTRSIRCRRFWQRAVARQSLLLHDRRLPLRLLRRRPTSRRRRASRWSARALVAVSIALHSGCSSRATS